MSTTTTARELSPDDLPPPDNPYYYGSRVVRRVRPDGAEYGERVPLTRRDVLHPQEGDYIVESDLHDLLRSYLASVCRARLAEVPGALVLSNTGIYWDDPDIEHFAPDVAVIFDVKEKRDEWASFDVAEQRTRPKLIIELVSPHVRRNDVVDKFEDYHTLGIARYVIADRPRRGADWGLLGFEHTPTGYLPMPADNQGRLWLEAVGVWLAAEGQRLVCYDGATGQPIGDYTEITRLLDQERGRAEAEKQRADTAEARASQLEEEIARLRGNGNPRV